MLGAQAEQATPLVQASRLDVTPHEPALGRRVGSLRERCHPATRRPWKARGKELRVAPDELPIAPRVTNNPADVDGVRPSVADGDGQGLGLGLLAVGSSGAGCGRQGRRQPTRSDWTAWS
jgi:hypothetical protein